MTILETLHKEEWKTYWIPRTISNELLNCSFSTATNSKFFFPCTDFFQAILLAIKLPCNIPWYKNNTTVLPHALWGKQNKLSMALCASHLKNHIHCNSSVNHVLKKKIYQTEILTMHFTGLLLHKLGQMLKNKIIRKYLNWKTYWNQFIHSKA